MTASRLSLSIEVHCSNVTSDVDLFSTASCERLNISRSYYSSGKKQRAQLTNSPARFCGTECLRFLKRSVIFPFFFFCLAHDGRSYRRAYRVFNVLNIKGRAREKSAIVHRYMHGASILLTCDR